MTPCISAGGAELVIDAFEYGSGMQVLNDCRQVAPGKNNFTVEASFLQNGIWVPRQFMVSSKAIAADSELLL